MSLIKLAKQTSTFGLSLVLAVMTLARLIRCARIVGIGHPYLLKPKLAHKRHLPYASAELSMARKRQFLMIVALKWTVLLRHLLRGMDSLLCLLNTVV